jgi:hypothetical protein
MFRFCEILRRSQKLAQVFPQNGTRLIIVFFLRNNLCQFTFVLRSKTYLRRPFNSNDYFAFNIFLLKVITYFL